MSRVQRPAARAFSWMVIALAATAAIPSSATSQTDVDLVLNLADAPDPTPAGGLITYSGSVSNAELLQATGVQFTLTVPANASYQGFTGASVTCFGMAVGQAGPGTVTCTLPNLAFSASVVFSLDLKTTVQGLVDIDAEVTSNETDSSLGNNTVSEQTTVVAGADVALTLTAPSPVPSGSLVAFNAQLDNLGPDVASSLEFQFPVPTGFNLTGGLPAGCSVGGGTIDCTVAGSIASGGSASIGPFTGQIYAASGSTVTGVASAGVIPLPPLGTALDPITTNNTDVANIAVTAGSDVQISKSRSVGGPYFVGDGFDFILTPSYTGDSPSGLTITDIIPANYTIGALAAVQNGWSCGLVGQTMTCSKGSGGVAGLNQALGTVSIPVTVNASGVGITNTGSIFSISPFDPDPSNNSDTDGGATLQDPTADLSLTKSGPSPALAVIGVPFNFTLRVYNGGPSEFYGTVVVEDQLPVGLTVNSITTNGWACDLPTPFSGAATLTCTRDFTVGSPLNSGSSTPNIVLNTTATVAGLLTNQADLTTQNPNVADPNPGNDFRTRSVTASPLANSADIFVVKTANPDPVEAGEVLRYTLEIVNLGPVAATSVNLADNLTTLINNSIGPTGAGYIGETITLGNIPVAGLTCSTSPGTNSRNLTCQAPSVPVCTQGADCATIDVEIRPGGNGGNRTNTATLISQITADPVLGNNNGSVTSVVLPRADITVTKTGAPNPATAGQELVYVVAARNNGPSQAQGVTISDILPLDVVFVSATPSSGTCGTTPGAGVATTAGNRTVDCSLNPINNGSQRTVTIRVKPTNATRGNTITNDVTVATTTVEPLVPGAANNNTSVDVLVEDPSLDLLVNKTDGLDPVAVAQATIYTVRVNNVGPSDAENVVITDDLPAVGLSFQGYSFPGGVCTTVPAVGDDTGAQLICSIARLNAGASATLTIDMQGEVKGVYTNDVQVESDETGLTFEDNSNNTADETTTVRTRADMEVVSKVATPATIAVRRPFDWTIQVRNNPGPLLAEADSVEVTDNLPAGIVLTGPPVVNVISGSASENTCTGVAGDTSFTCDLGTVTSTAVVDIVAPVRALSVPAGGTSTNSTTVTTSSLDVTPGNNTNTGLVTIQGSSLSGTVFRDFADDGGIDPTDTGISGITMTLTGTAFDGSPVSLTTSTNGSGNYSFGDLPEGSYTIQRGAVAETFLTVGQQIVGDRAGDAGTVGEISSIALGGIDTGTGYLFGFVPRARIGVAKRSLAAPVLNPDSSFTVDFRLVMENFSLETLNAVSLTDDLAGVAPRFGTFVAGGAGVTLGLGSYTIQTAPALTGACATATANAAFDGDVDPVVATIAAFPAAASCEVAFSLRFVPQVPLPPAGYTNQASVEGTGALSGQNPTDLSQSGADPDPSGDDDPTNDNTPTPLTPTLIADVTTALVFPAGVDAGELVAGTVLFENAGPFQAEGVGYTLELSPGLDGLTFTNLPVGVTPAYNSGNGIVTFTGMPGILHAGEIASGDGVGPIGVEYVQPGTATSNVASGITTTTNQGANTLPDVDSLVVGGGLIADVTTALSFPAFVASGSPATGTILYQNDGPSIASDMVYILELTPGLSGIAFSNLPAGAIASYDAGTGVVTFTGMPATLNPGEIASGDGVGPIELTFTQPNSGVANISSEIGTSTNQGSNRAPDSDVATVVGDATVGIAKAGSILGDTVTYDIKIKNTGTAPADSLSVVDDLSAAFGANNFTLVGAPTLYVAPTYGSISLDPGFTGYAGGSELVNQSNPTGNVLQPGDSAVIRIRVQVTNVTDRGYGVGVFANQATSVARGPGTSGTFTDSSADGNDVDPNGNGDPKDDTSPTFVTMPVDATVGIAKRAAVSGWRVTFDLVLVNTGNAEAAQITVRDNLDEVFGPGNYALATAPFFMVDPGTLILNPAFTGSGLGSELLSPPKAGLNTLAPGETAVIRFEVDILRPADMGNGVGVYENQARTTSWGPGATGPFTDESNDGDDPDPDGDGDPGNNSIPTVFALPLADLALQKVGPATAQVGDTIQYTITVTNHGPGPSVDALIQDMLPSGVAFVAASDGGTEAGGVVSWPAIPQMAPGAVLIRTVDVRILQAGDWENVASVSSPLDPIPGNNDGTSPDNKTTVTTGDPMADLEVTKSGPAVASVGDTISYLITTKNLGLDAASSVVMMDSLPDGVVFVGASRGATANGRYVTWPAIATLQPGASVVDTVSVWAPRAGSYTNVASATSPTPDPEPENNDGSEEDSSVTTTVGGVDLIIEKTLGSALTAGSEATWNLVVTNVGTMPTTGTITVVDDLPAGLTFVSAAGDGWVCSALGQEVTCTRDDLLQPGASATLVLTTQVDAQAGETIINGATVSTPGDDSEGDDNKGETDPTDVEGEGELVLEKFVSESVVEVGGLIRYELELRNVGLGSVLETVIQDRLPVGFSLVSGSVAIDGKAASDPDGAPGPVLAFPVGDVAAGQTVRISYTLRVGVGADQGTHVNLAQAFSGDFPASNEASAAVQVELGVFSDLGHILGRVWVEVPDSGGFSSPEQADRYDRPIGVPGVRVFLQDGTSAVTDQFGRYSFTDLRPRTWVVRVDERTLPVGVTLRPLTTRHMGDGVAKMVGLTMGEMARADFGDAGADTLLYQVVEDRAAMGPVPDVAVPNALGLRAGGSMRRGTVGPMSRRVAGTTIGGVAGSRTGGMVGTSLQSRGEFSPLFKRPGSTSGMTLDSSSDRFGRSPYVTGSGLGMASGGPGMGSGGGASSSTDGLRMLISGFIEGRFDQRSLTDGELFQGGTRDRFQDALMEWASSGDDGKQLVGARAAAFATGDLGDGYQLTLRLDSEKDPTRRFFNDIRPEEAYDVFGDASATLFEAQSKGRVFGAVSRGASYLMYGDFNTSTYDGAQLLGRYSRTLNGAVTQIETDRTAVRAFASRDRFQQIVDEMPGMGISGPYALSRPDGLLNSERVEIITRDRNQPGVILDIQPLERFTDYTIEPFTGRLIFRRPVPSVDDQLNPVSIRVSYESETGGDSFWVFGADARADATDRLSLGAGFVRDDNPTGHYELFSANAGLTLGAGTWMTGEFARSDSADIRSGNALRVELRHASERLDFRGFFLKADSAFQNTSAGVGVGRTEMGLSGVALLQENTSLLAEVIRSEDDRTDAALTGGRVALRQKLGERFNAQLGYRYASEEDETVSAVGARLEIEAIENGTLFGEFEQDISNSDARRLALGGDIRVLDRMRLYARHEFLSSLAGPYTMGRMRDRNSTVFGVSADYREGQSVFSEYRVGNGISGRGAHAAIGLRNQWEIDEGIRLHSSFERVSAMDTVGGGDALAVTGGLEITSSPFWKATARVEYRASERQDHILGTVGLARRINDQFTVLAQSIGSKIMSGGALYERTRVGLAYRSESRNGLNALARYEHRTDDDPLAPAGPRDHSAHILSTHLNLRPVDGLTARAQWAAKFANDELAGQTIDQSAQLLSGRATVDLGNRFDAGVVGRTHFGEDLTEYGLGVDVGVNIGGDLRLGLGYNWFGFTDDDLSLDEYTDKGFFIDLGWRFDESLFGWGDDDGRRVGEPRNR